MVVLSVSASPSNVFVCSGGLTNKLYKCTNTRADANPQHALLRVYCNSSEMMPRSRNVAICVLMGERGLCPRVLGMRARLIAVPLLCCMAHPNFDLSGVFEQGCLEQWVDGRVLKVCSIIVNN